MPKRCKTLALMALLLLLLLVHAGVAAQEQATKKRTLTEAQYKALTNDKALDYKNEREIYKPVSENKNASLLKKLVELLARGSMSGLASLLLWGALLAVVIFAVYKLATMKGSFMFGRKKKIMGHSGPPAMEDDITGVNWEQRLQEAMAKGDTRMVVRYYYMWLLQLLQASGMILYRNDKTNYDYYAELADSSYKQPFRQLSRTYEYAWYGNFALTQGSFDEYAATFYNLKKHLGK